MARIASLVIIVVYMTSCSGYNTSEVKGLHIESTPDGGDQLVSRDSLNETGDFMISFSAPEIYMIMDGRRSINVSYNVVCPTRETVHRVKVYTTERDVAYTTLSGVINISCDLPDNSLQRGVLAGNLNPRKNGTESSEYLYPLHGSRYSESASLNPDSEDLNSVQGDLNSKSENVSLMSGNVHSVSGNLNINLKADIIGRTWLVFELIDSSSNNTSGLNGNGTEVSGNVQKCIIVVIRQHRTIDTVFMTVVYITMVVNTIGIGCTIETKVVKSVLKKPIAPAIGVVCQFLCMPLIAFGVAKLVKFENPAEALGVFACGACPDGGLSNIFSYLLGGDVSLSITMTIISNIGALGIVPLWMFTLGDQFKDDKMEIRIPFLDIVRTLATVIFPLFIGLAIKYKCPKVAEVIAKVLKPITFITVIIFLTLGIYANLYIFRLFRPSSLLAGCLLPYIGYLCGGIVGLICRQPWYRVKTIAIETGIQNVTVAYLMLQMALDPPDGDLASVGPAASAFMTPLPLFLSAILYNIYLKCTNQKPENHSHCGQNDLSNNDCKDGQIREDMKDGNETEKDAKLELLEKN